MHGTEVHQVFGRWSGRAPTPTRSTVTLAGILGFAKESRSRLVSGQRGTVTCLEMERLAPRVFDGTDLDGAGPGDRALRDRRVRRPTLGVGAGPCGSPVA
jgi:hypothetical protein